MSTVTIPSQGWQFFCIEVSEEINSLMAQTIGFSGDDETNPLQIYIRYGAAPDLMIYDVQGIQLNSSDILATYLQPGMGFVLIGVYNSNDTSVETTLTADLSSCASGSTGFNCSAYIGYINETSYFPDQGLPPYSWAYYVVDLNQTFLFYVRSNSQNTTPAAYARIINFPTAQLYDLVSQGSQVNVLNAKDIQTTVFYLRESIMFAKENKAFMDTRKWYIGLYNPTDQEISYGTWTNTDCPDDCNGNGACVNNICQCTGAYEGDACDEQEEGFKVEYIILIVVGSAIIISSVVGIIIWAVKKRKRGDYESF